MSVPRRSSSRSRRTSRGYQSSGESRCGQVICASTWSVGRWAKLSGCGSLPVRNPRGPRPGVSPAGSTTVVVKHAPSSVREYSSSATRSRSRVVDFALPGGPASTIILGRSRWRAARDSRWRMSIAMLRSIPYTARSFREGISSVKSRYRTVRLPLASSTSSSVPKASTASRTYCRAARMWAAGSVLTSATYSSKLPFQCSRSSRVISSSKRHLPFRLRHGVPVIGDEQPFALSYRLEMDRPAPHAVQGLESVLRVAGPEVETLRARMLVAQVQLRPVPVVVVRDPDYRLSGVRQAADKPALDRLPFRLGDLVLAAPLVEIVDVELLPPAEVPGEEGAQEPCVGVRLAHMEDELASLVEMLVPRCKLLGTGAFFPLPAEHPAVPSLLDVAEEVVA